MVHVVEMDVAGRRLRLETGRVAKQADGAVLATYADTVVLATAVASQTVKPGVDFLPLTVDYQEKAYAAGKIPGGYFKREGRPSEKEVLTSRLIDRPMRPLFPEGYYFETQVIASVLSADQTGSSDVVGITAASAALTLSDIPFEGPVAGVKIGRVNGQFVVNPTLETLETSDLHLVVAGTAGGRRDRRSRPARVPSGPVDTASPTQRTPAAPEALISRPTLRDDSREASARLPPHTGPSRLFATAHPVPSTS